MWTCSVHWSRAMFELSFADVQSFLPWCKRMRRQCCNSFVQIWTRARMAVMDFLLMTDLPAVLFSSPLDKLLRRSLPPCSGPAMLGPSSSWSPTDLSKLAKETNYSYPKLPWSCICAQQQQRKVIQALLLPPMFFFTVRKRKWLVKNSLRSTQLVSDISCFTLVWSPYAVEFYPQI